LERFRPSRRY